MFSRIFSNTKVRGTLYILKDIREYGVRANTQMQLFGVGQVGQGGGEGWRRDVSMYGSRRNTVRPTTGTPTTVKLNELGGTGRGCGTY